MWPLLPKSITRCRMFLAPRPCTARKRSRTQLLYHSSNQTSLFYRLALLSDLLTLLPVFHIAASPTSRNSLSKTSSHRRRKNLSSSRRINTHRRRRISTTIKTRPRGAKRFQLRPSSSSSNSRMRITCRRMRVGLSGQRRLRRPQTAMETKCSCPTFRKRSPGSSSTQWLSVDLAGPSKQ